MKNGKVSNCEYFVNYGCANDVTPVPFVEHCRRTVKFYKKYGLSLINCRDGICWFNKVRGVWESAYVSKTHSCYGLISRIRFERLILSKQINLLRCRIYDVYKHVVSNCNRKSFNCKKFYRKYVFLSELNHRYSTKYYCLCDCFIALIRACQAEQEYNIKYDFYRCVKNVVSLPSVFQKLEYVYISGDDYRVPFIRYWRYYYLHNTFNMFVKYESECSKWSNMSFDYLLSKADINMVNVPKNKH